jgi:lipopolysaccharide transport system permease protein
MSTSTYPGAAGAPRALSGEMTVIRPRRGWESLQLGELWRYRELLATLALRDIRVRYKQTVLGAAWAVIQPLAQMIVFTAFFASHGFSTEGAPAPVFYFAGLLPWQLFATSVAAAGNSLVANRGLVTKVYFPRLVIPVAAVASAVVDFAISFVVLLAIMAFNHTVPSANIVFLPLFLLVGILAALGIGVWLSALNVEFRDVQYVIPFLVQFWLFVTPVIYPSSSVAGFRRVLLGLNPMSGVVEAFRWCVLGRPAPGSTLLTSVASIVVVLGTGLLFFRRAERTFADQL